MGWLTSKQENLLSSLIALHALSNLILSSSTYLNIKGLLAKIVFKISTISTKAGKYEKMS